MRGKVSKKAGRRRASRKAGRGERKEVREKGKTAVRSSK